MKSFSRSYCLILLASVLWSGCLRGESIPVRHPQGSAHGFLALKTPDGRRLATGDLTQTVRGDRVTSRVTFRFDDGSIDDEVTVFSQRGVFRLISDHHLQRGPRFPKPIDVFIDATTGLVTSRTQDGKVTHDHLDLPSDVSNGLPPNLLMNVDPSAAETKVSFVAPTKKPRLVHLSIKNEGKISFTVGHLHLAAVDYVVHVELGGVSGAIAPVIGKQPSDYHIWILPGTAPAFIREEGQLFEGGPVWRIEQISPTFAK